jgi:thioredoxin 1
MKNLTQLEELNEFTNQQGLVLLKFHATWCGPCKSFAPVVDNVANVRPDITFLAVDIDQLPELREQYLIRSVPSLVLLKNGEHVDTLVGSNTASNVNEWINKQIAA